MEIGVAAPGRWSSYDDGAQGRGSVMLGEGERGLRGRGSGARRAPPPAEEEVVQLHEAPSGCGGVVELGEGPGSIGVLGRSTRAVGGSTRARWCSSAGRPRRGRVIERRPCPSWCSRRFPRRLGAGEVVQLPRAAIVGLGASWCSRWGWWSSARSR